MDKLLRFVTQAVWALEPSIGLKMTQVLNRRIAGERVSDDELADIIEERRARASARLKRGGAPEKPAAESDNGARQPVQMGSVRVIPIDGIITPYASMINGTSQPVGTAVGTIQSWLQDAAASPDVKSILLDIDSPGGTVAGGNDIVDAVRTAAKQKPVYAYAHDQMCSGAYLLGSQARGVYTSAMGFVGSIGVLVVVSDSSERARQEGETLHLIRSGAYKAAGSTPGVAVSESDLRSIQEQINQVHETFVQLALRDGRRMTAEAANAVADGRVFVGVNAQAAGLVDGVLGFGDMVALLESRHGATSSFGVTPGRMSEQRSPGSRMAVDSVPASASLIADRGGSPLPPSLRDDVSRQRVGSSPAVSLGETPARPLPEVPPATRYADSVRRFAAKVGTSAAYLKAAKSDPDGHRAWVNAACPTISGLPQLGWVPDPSLPAFSGTRGTRASFLARVQQLTPTFGQAKAITTAMREDHQGHEAWLAEARRDPSTALIARPAGSSWEGPGASHEATVAAAPAFSGTRGTRASFLARVQQLTPTFGQAKAITTAMREDHQGHEAWLAEARRDPSTALIARPAGSSWEGPGASHEATVAAAPAFSGTRGTRAGFVARAKELSPTIGQGAALNTARHEDPAGHLAWVDDGCPHVDFPRGSTWDGPTRSAAETAKPAVMAAVA